MGFLVDKHKEAHYGGLRLSGLRYAQESSLSLIEKDLISFIACVCVWENKGRKEKASVSD